MTPKNVMIVGMPRSGTSLMAGALAGCGYYVTEDPEAGLRPPDHHNPGGYWEAESLTQLNASLFGAAGYPEDNSWLGHRISDEAVKRIWSLEPGDTHRGFMAGYEARSPWLWKDPRLCYTLPFWWPLARGDSTRVLLIRRDPEAIWQSFVRLRWREATAEAKADVLSRVVDHLTAAEEAIARLGIPHLEVRYEDVADHPEAVAKRISDFLSVDIRPDQLGFSRGLDHSRPRGRLGTFLEHRYEALPPGLRRIAKRLTPQTLIRALFPERRA
jgi:hypothetical protein